MAGFRFAAATIHEAKIVAPTVTERGIDMQLNIMTPMLALICWTFVLWLWMYATRIPGMRAAGIDPAKVKRKEDLDALPLRTKQIADNYNHLHEQPTVFYALVVYSQLVGVHDALNVWLAWVYVGVRVVHSIIQCTANFVPLRFFVFALGSLVLMAMTARNVFAWIAVN